MGQKEDDVNPWIQVAGHSDCFVPFDENRKVAKAMKSRDRSEYQNYLLIEENDALYQFLPQFHGLLESDEKGTINQEDLHKSEEWFVLTNVLTGYHDPVVMDVKMGRNTCGMRQLNVKLSKRPDLYQKCCDLGFPFEMLTDDERRDEAVTKFRYAELRDLVSTSSQYGFRVEAMNIDNFSKRDYANANQLEQSFLFCKQFAENISSRQLEHLISRLKTFQTSVLQSKFCQSHQLIGSSLLIAYDREADCEQSGVWLIDLFQATKFPPEAFIEDQGEGSYCNTLCNNDVIQGASQLCRLFERVLQTYSTR